MTGNLRIEVLSIFKKLHRTRLKVFNGDEHALNFTRDKINSEFRKNKLVEDENAVKELIKFGKDVEQQVCTTVIQLREKVPGIYEAQIRPEVLVDNDVSHCGNIVPSEKIGSNRSKKCKDISKK